MGYDHRLKDRVIVVAGPNAGRYGTVTAILMHGYHVHLDHPATEVCRNPTFYPGELLAANPT